MLMMRSPCSSRELSAGAPQARHGALGSSGSTISHRMPTGGSPAATARSTAGLGVPGAPQHSACGRKDQPAWTHRLTVRALPWEFHKGCPRGNGPAATARPTGALVCRGTSLWRLAPKPEHPCEVSFSSSSWGSVTAASNWRLKQNPGSFGKVCSAFDIDAIKETVQLLEAQALALRDSPSLYRRGNTWPGRLKSEGRIGPAIARGWCEPGLPLRSLWWCPLSSPVPTFARHRHAHARNVLKASFVTLSAPVLHTKHRTSPTAAFRSWHTVLAGDAACPDPGRLKPHATQGQHIAQRA